MYSKYIATDKWPAFLYLFILAAGIQACSRQLDKLPTDQVDEQVIFSSVQTLEQGVIGVYADFNEEYMLQIGSVPTDECRIGLKNAGVNASAQQLFRWSFSIGDKDITNVWANAYQVIARANKILSHIDDVPVKNAAETLKRNLLKGELLTIRAFMHFELYRTFSYSPVYAAAEPAVPYVVDAGINNKPSRPATVDFFRMLKQDLAGAETLLGRQAEGSNIRMGINALLSLEARIALYTNDWEDAVTRSSVLIEKVALASADVFPGIWQDQSDAEVIFKLKRTNLSALRPGDLWKNVSTGIVLFAPASKLMQLYDSANDVRYRSYFGADSTLIDGGQLPNVINKYAGQPGALNLADVKVFRVAEMYLIRAEAYAHLDQLEKGTDDLNNLRSARIDGYHDEQFANTGELINAVFLERYKELAFEGHRLFDLRRTRKNIERNAEDQPAGVTKNVLTPTEVFYHTPIPQAELLVNKNILPNNPGW